MFYIQTGIIIKFRKGKRILKQEDRKDCSVCAGRVLMVMPCECGLCAVESCPNISNHVYISKTHISLSKNTTGLVWSKESKSSFWLQFRFWSLKDFSETWYIPFTHSPEVITYSSSQMSSYWPCLVRGNLI